MRRLIVLLVLVFGPAATSGPGFAGRAPEAIEKALADGLSLYEEGRFSEAWDRWGQILEAGYGSSDLLMNLGNAAYKTGRIGWAIYYYELARRASPRDPDILSNLALARRDALGPERPPDRSPILGAIVSLQNQLTLGQAVRLLAGAFWVASGLILLTWFWVRSGRWFGLLRGAALGIVLLAGLAVGVKWSQVALMPEAIAVRPLSVRSEPLEDATVEFRLPEGSPVSLDRESPGWREIVVSKSLRGWVAAEAVALLGDPAGPEAR